MKNGAAGTSPRLRFHNLMKGGTTLEETESRSRTLGPLWLRLVMLLGGSLCMGMAVAVAVQWVITGSVGDIREWFEKWPTYLLLTGVLCGAVVFTLGALLGRLWLSALLVGAAGLVLALVDYFKTTINGTPLALADFGLAAQLGDVAGVAGELHPPEDFWRALVGPVHLRGAAVPLPAADGHRRPGPVSHLFHLSGPDAVACFSPRGPSWRERPFRWM